MMDLAVIPIFAVSNTWIGVIGALGGVTITSLIALATAILNHRWTAETTLDDRRHEVQFKRAELRRDAYARYLASIDNLRDFVMAAERPARIDAELEPAALWMRARPDLFQEVQLAENYVRVLASDPVQSRLDDYFDTINEYLIDMIEQPDEADLDSQVEAKTKLLLAMRDEQAADLATSDEHRSLPR